MMRDRVWMKMGLIMLFCVGWGTSYVTAQEAVIHPLALENALGWIADTEKSCISANILDGDNAQQESVWLR